MMYDSKTPGRKWNISYFDYTSNMATAETQSDYSKYIFLNLCTVAKVLFIGQFTRQNFRA